MSLDGIVISAISKELKDKIIEGKIEKIYQPENDEILINIRSNKGNYKLVLSASSNNPRIYLSNITKDNPIKPPMFCMLLRKHIQGGRIIDVTQTLFERILNLHIVAYDELGNKKEKLLVIEVMGRHSNIILIDKDTNLIIDSVKRIPLSISSVRQILPGLEYTLPPSQNKLNPLDVDKKMFLDKISSFNEGTSIYKILYQGFMGISPLISKEIISMSNLNESFSLGELDNLDALYNSFELLMNNVKNNNYSPSIVIEEDSNKLIAFSAINLNHLNNYKVLNYDSISKVLETFYYERDNYDRISQKSIGLRKTISTKIDRNLNKLAKQNKELNEAEKREKYKIYGDLIISNIYKIKDKEKELVCNNYYSEDNELIKIDLDPRLNPSQNAQKYYKKYNKLKNAHELVTNELEKTKEEIDYLENVYMSIENCSNSKELDEIREELISEGYLKSKNKNKNKKNKDSGSSPKQFLSSEGYDIYVGKNNKQNDYLTMKFANKDDLWLHTKDIPGSHVIIKNKGENIPENTIFEAANIAAFFSKAKMSSNVPVDYTQKKNVKKPNGSKPGMVIYETNSTIYVTPDEKLIEKLNIKQATTM